jgi:hypothetical protein
MKSYTEREFLHRHRWALDLMDGVIAAIPHLDKQGREIRCHELARVATHVLSNDPRRHEYDRHVCIGPDARHPIRGTTRFRAVDGKFGPAEHSWVVVDDGKPYHDPAILDVYSVASLPQVQLLFGGYMFRDVRKVFVPGPERDDIREDVIDDLLWMLGKKRYVPAPGEQ